LACFIIQAGTGAVLAADTAKVVIITTNDIHGQLQPKTNKHMVEPPEKVGGLAYVATVIKDIERDYPGKYLLIDIGDFAQGTIESNSFIGRPVLEFMNYCGYDAMCMGNHEFDWGVEKMGETLKDAKFPILCANVIEEKTGKLIPYCKPYVIKNINGVKIGLIGVLTPVTKKIVKAENIKGYDIEEPADVVNRLVPILRTKGAKLIIVMSHCGLAEDREMAKKIKDVQLIAGGHSHSFIMKPEKVNDILITQCGCKGYYVGKLLLEVDKETGKIVKYNEDYMIPVINKEITPDPEMVEMVAKYREKVKPIMERTIGEIDMDLDNDRAYKGLDSKIGNLITDGLRSQTESDIAFYNAGGIRSSFKKGKICFGDVFAVLPFDDAVVTMDLTGKQVKEILVHGFNKKGVVQFSGLTVTYDPAKEGEERIVKVMVGDEPLEPGKIYRVTTTAFLATGGDGYDTFLGGKNVKYGDFARDVFSFYLKNHSPVKKVELGRVIKLEKEEKPESK
ncbi:MAG: bifunctional metallophosphatase/5'-nucleotidase, partial [Candidatus Eremiobacteraeota bacterium]|nr:bifunctional metallophosphatase/5'-nucleotidase [Candidatus Eremiobacteraeota bacterium]